MEPGGAEFDSQVLDQARTFRARWYARLSFWRGSELALEVGQHMVGKNEIVTKLKHELDSTIALVVRTREALEQELIGEHTGVTKHWVADKVFVSKLKELTSAFNSLTESKIRLDKAEKAMEAELTPAEERAAVVTYLATIQWNDAQKMYSEAQMLRKSLE